MQRGSEIVAATHVDELVGNDSFQMIVFEMVGDRTRPEKGGAARGHRKGQRGAARSLENDALGRPRQKRAAADRGFEKSKQGGVKQSGQEPLDIQKTG